MKTEVFRKQIIELDWSRPDRSANRFLRGLYGISSQGNLTFDQKLEVITIYSQYEVAQRRATLDILSAAELLYLEKILEVLDTWEQPWLTAISRGFIYRGDNPVLKSAGELLK